MNESFWALVVIGVLLHRMLDLYGVYHKWMQVYRHYNKGSSMPSMPRTVRFVSENFPKIAMTIILVMLVFSAAVIQNVAGSENSLAATIPAISFSVTVSFFGAFADFHREQASNQ